MVNVVGKSVKTVKETLEALAQEADRLLAHRALQQAARAHGSIQESLGMAKAHLAESEINL